MLSVFLGASEGSLKIGREILPVRSPQTPNGNQADS